MRVFENDDHRVIARHPVYQRDKTRLHIADECRLIASLGHAEKEGQPLDGPIRLCRVAPFLHQLTEQAADLFWRVAGLDPRQVADDGSRRRERRRIRGRARPAPKDGHQSANTGRELIGQA